LKFYKNNIAKIIQKHKTIIFLFIVCFIFLHPQKIADNSSTSFHFVNDGYVVVALGTNDNSYFLRNGHVMGYHFELIKKYCNKIKCKPVFIVEEDIDKRLDLLLANQADIAVCDIKTDSILKIKNINPVYIDENFSPSFWAVDNKNNGLAKNINLWINSYTQTKDYSFLAAKYNLNQIYRKSQTISDYDDLIKKYSEKINWDWRLIAALIYQESQFIPDLKSHKDAFGLMQIRQQTAEFLGFDSIDSNEKNIAAGTKLIKFLEKHFAKDSTINETELVKFVLAAYNSGHGKIDICRRNTAQKGRNANIWIDVEITNRRKKREQNAPKTKESYLSSETINFVNEILERYEHYRNFF
jgi:membrane-bound lytic murein transglycosylase F